MTEPTIVVIGNLTKDPQLAFGPSGKPWVKFAVAYTPRAKNPGTGRWEDSGETQFHDCKAFGKLAENVAESLLRGDAVIVTGRQEQREYTAHDGSRRTAVDLIAEDVGTSLRRYPARPMRAERVKAGADTPDAWVSAEPLPPF